MADAEESVKYTAEYLAVVDIPNRLYDVIGSDQKTWNKQTVRKNTNSFDSQAIINDDVILRKMLEEIRIIGMAKIFNIPLDILEARRILERISYIRSSIFGEMWKLRADGKLDDTGSTPLDISPHTDGTYNHDSPGIMSLFCLNYNASGGDNIFVDGFNVMQDIRSESPKIFKLLYRVSIPGQYIGDGAYLAAMRPVCRVDDYGNIIQVSYNNHDRAPFYLPEPEMSELYEGLSLFDRKINDPSNQCSIPMRAGEMVIFDNWRLLHGRKAFEGNRHMVGYYINREDFESKLRLLSNTPIDMIGRTNL